jgi:hypothetical protein
VGQLIPFAEAFDDWKLIVFESDSDDATLETLLQLQRELGGGRVEVLAARHVPGRRTQRIAYARNALLRHLEANHPPRAADVVVALDMDNVNSRIAGWRSAMRVFDQKAGARAVFPNQRVYYDRWALRTGVEPVACRQASWAVCNDFGLWGPPFTSSRDFHIPPHWRPIPVHSAFGGVGIYPREALVGLTYDGDADCEHVSMHAAMARRGCECVIVPDFVNVGFGGFHELPPPREDMASLPPDARAEPPSLVFKKGSLFAVLALLLLAGAGVLWARAQRR